MLLEVLICDDCGAGVSRKKKQSPTIYQQFDWSTNYYRDKARIDVCPDCVEERKGE